MQTPKRLKIAYITMVFPHPQEPFSASDIRAIKEHCVEVKVYSMRFAHRKTRELVHSWSLNDVTLDHAGWKTPLRAVCTIVRQPKILGTFASALRQYPLSPKHIVKTLISGPRAIEILGQLQRESPDIMHLLWGHYPSLVAYLTHHHMSDLPTSIFLGAYDLAQNYPISWAIARKAQLVFTHAHANVQKFAQMQVDSQRVHVIYRGIDLNEFDLQRNNHPKDPNLMVYVGRITRSKRIDLVVDVFRKVYRQNPQARLKIVGDGPQLTYWMGRVRQVGLDKRVEFTGLAGRAEVIDTLYRAGFLVLLSDNDRIPNAVKEAMACRCVVVVSDTPGMRELVTDDRYGFIVQKQDTNVASRIIAELMNDKRRREDIGQQAQKWVYEHFDNRKTMKRYYDAFVQQVKKQNASKQPAGE